MTSEGNHRLKGLLRLTMACNARCLFCNVPIENYNGGILGEEDISRALQHLVEEKARTITISGGEPTIAKTHLLELVRRSRDRGIEFVDLQTNAMLIDDEYALELAEAGVTSAFVPLLSHLPETHDHLMGVTGAYAGCLAGIDALLGAGIDVRLNPVTVKQTETLVPDYVDFVSRRFPSIHFVSLSVMQPHGRAADNLALLPHYSRLRPAIAQARRLATLRGIEMVNPYCGVPICIGWSDALEKCVEAVQAVEARVQPMGLRNRGNKSHGEPCRKCAFRSLCGGAWHAYWVHRKGDGIDPPAKIVEPWLPAADELHLQSVVRAPGGANRRTWRLLEECQTPVVWLWTDTLRTEDADRIVNSRCNAFALQVDAGGFGEVNETVRAMQRLLKLSRQRDTQRRPWSTLGLLPEGSWTAKLRAVAIADALHLGEVVLLGPRNRQQDEFVRLISGRFPRMALVEATDYRTVGA